MAVSPAAWPEYRRLDASSADDDNGSDPLYPSSHVSAFAGVVAAHGGADLLGSHSADEDLAFHVGLAHAVYNDLGVDVGGLGGNTDGLLPGPASPSAGSPPLVASGPDLSIATSHLVQPDGQHGVALILSTSGADSDERASATPRSSSYASVLTAHGERTRRTSASVGLDDGSSSESSSTEAPAGIDQAPLPIGGATAAPISTPAVADVPHSLTSRPDGTARANPTDPPARVALAKRPPSASAGGVNTIPVLDALPTLGSHDATDGGTPTPSGTHLEGDVDGTDAGTTVGTQDAPRNDDVPVRCWRHLYICPSQGRYFGDRGSFVDYFDPLGGGESMCVENNIAPYGSMVVWRIMSTFDCDEGCEFFDNVLEEGVTSIPVLFKRDPYGELLDIVSDRYLPVLRRLRSPRRKRSNSM